MDIWKDFDSYSIKTILVTSKGNIHNKPILNYSGLPIDNDEDYKYELENIIEKTVKTFSLNNQNQKENIIEAIKISCRKITKEITGKKPFDKDLNWA